MLLVQSRQQVSVIYPREGKFVAFQFSFQLDALLIHIPIARTSTVGVFSLRQLITLLVSDPAQQFLVISA